MWWSKVQIPIWLSLTLSSVSTNKKSLKQIDMKSSMLIRRIKLSSSSFSRINRRSPSLLMSVTLCLNSSRPSLLWLLRRSMESPRHPRLSTAVWKYSKLILKQMKSSNIHSTTSNKSKIIPSNQWKSKSMDRYNPMISFTNHQKKHPSKWASSTTKQTTIYSSSKPRELLNQNKRVS